LFVCLSACTIDNLFFLNIFQITMWDLSTGKCVRSILDAHPPGSAVLHVLVKFILVSCAHRLG
jgi:hypothetical protein